MVIGNGSNHDLALNTLLTLLCAEIHIFISDIFFCTFDFANQLTEILSCVFCCIFQTGDNIRWETKEVVLTKVR